MEHEAGLGCDSGRLGGPCCRGDTSARPWAHGAVTDEDRGQAGGRARQAGQAVWAHGGVREYVQVLGWAWAQPGTASCRGLRGQAEGFRGLARGCSTGAGSARVKERVGMAVCCRENHTAARLGCRLGGHTD